MNRKLISLDNKNTGLWIMDVQEKLATHVEGSHKMLEKICFMIDVAKILHFPIVITEQFPQGLGETISTIKNRLPEEQIIYPKNSFSGFKEPLIQQKIEKSGLKNWILVGIETHICILQTVKDLIEANKGVIVLNDGVSSRSHPDSMTAIEEMREIGARISTAETVVYEMIGRADSIDFKKCLPLIKAQMTQ